MSHRQPAGRGPAAATQLIVGCVALCLMLGAAPQEPQDVPDHHRDFSDVERWRAHFENAERAERQKPETVAALMEVKPGMTVADLGAGTGYFLPYLSAAVGSDGLVLALDPEPNMVAFIKERCEREGLTNVEPRRIPFDDPQLAAGSADRILIVNTWHHIEARADYSAKLLAALAPGGRVYVLDFHRDSPIGPRPNERIEPGQVMREMEGGGLQAEGIEEDLPLQYVVVGRRPL
ncbi:MAG: methyltransferase domain-containing protein [bacterium]|nr:methyltransferase domain-containing protein [bacterium]